MDGELDSLSVKIVELGLAVWWLSEAALQTSGRERVVHDVQCQLVYLP